MDACHTVFERLIELTKSSYHKIYEMINVGISFLFIIDGIDLFVSMFLLDSKKIVNRILQDFSDFFRDKLFLYLKDNLHRLRRP